MQRLIDRGMIVDLQILDNKDSAVYKRIITTKWEVAFQLVPPNIHRRNAAEREIRTFKAHFFHPGRRSRRLPTEFVGPPPPPCCTRPQPLTPSYVEPKCLSVGISRGTLRLQC